MVLPEEWLTLPLLEREVPPEERDTELLPVAGARVTAEERVVPLEERVVTPERLPEALRVVTPERWADVALVAEPALRLPEKLRLDVTLRPAERTEPPMARGVPA